MIMRNTRNIFMFSGVFAACILAMCTICLLLNINATMLQSLLFAKSYSFISGTLIMLVAISGMSVCAFNNESNIMLIMIGLAFLGVLIPTLFS